MSILRKAKVKGLWVVLYTALTERKHMALEKGSWDLSKKLLWEAQEMDSDPFMSRSMSLQPPSYHLLQKDKGLNQDWAILDVCR